MKDTTIEKNLKEVRGLDSASETISRGIHNAVLEGGEPARKVADVLHGTWLGHPLHPALTDFVVGAFSFGTLFNLMGGELNATIARTLIKAGAIAAVPTALSGATDYSTVARRAMNTALVHGGLNAAALVLYLLSLRNGGRPSGKSKLLSTLGFGVMFVSAGLGGKMTYQYRVGVNKAEQPDGPIEWTRVLGASGLIDNQAKRVTVEDADVMLYKRDSTVYAIGAVCPHEGGPLEKGTIFEKGDDGLCVECPWHQSVFALEDGRVIHGPSTYRVPAYDARIREGQVEIRLMQHKRSAEKDSRLLETTGSQGPEARSQKSEVRSQ
ncbi:MAG TPA: nitrite reductase (NAD(P)H) small subunit [Acidobacteriota bacterium]|nr:nitrite reductase (NAD(P)H) small subunit [Acidobacteriota bacterium]